MNKYKTFEELKEELGNKFEEYMYKANIELLNKIDKAIEYIESYNTDFKNCRFGEAPISMRELGDLLDILKGEDKEVEIIEEDKKIEKLDLQYKDITKVPMFKEEILLYCDNLQYKINEIIDYINKEKK